MKILTLEKRNSTNFAYLRYLSLDYIEINIAEQKLGKRYFSTLAELKNVVFIFSAASHLHHTAELKHSVVDKVIDQWLPRLRTRVRDKGQHFEQLLN